MKILFSEFGKSLFLPTFSKAKQPGNAGGNKLFQNFTLYKVFGMIILMGEIPEKPRNPREAKGLKEKFQGGQAKMERMPFESWEKSYGHLETAAEKRERILEFFRYFVEQDKRLEAMGERTVGNYGYFPTWKLRLEICRVMKWGEEKRYSGWTREIHVIDFDLSDERVTEMIKRIELQGFIKLSKSGEGYKVLRTK